MKIIASTGNPQVSTVYIAEFDQGRCVEMAEAVQPPVPLHEKWVLIVSTLFGCPAKCLMCDAGGNYHGKLTKQEIFDQLDFLITNRFPDRRVPVSKFKIQFARMGEPALNSEVLDVLEELLAKYDAPGLIPSISTVAPVGTDSFFQKLTEIKSERYANGRFQLQFSIHTTDVKLRDKLVPIKKWDFAQIARYGDRFLGEGDRKIALNFALTRQAPLEPEALLEYFDPDKFMIKITPLNPTYAAARNKLSSYVDPSRDNNHSEIVSSIRRAGYDVIVSIGEIEENYIGSNCGQYLRRHLESKKRMTAGYSYDIKEPSFTHVSGSLDNRQLRKNHGNNDQ